MKILRVRRGFSTNCSGANEYFSPQALPPPGSDLDGGITPWSQNPDATVVFRWVTFMPDGAPPPMLRQALAASASADAGPDGASGPDAGLVPADGGVADGGALASGGDGTNGTASDDHPRSTGGVGLIIFLAMLAVLVFFAAERLFRRIRRGRQGKS